MAGWAGLDVTQLQQLTGTLAARSQLQAALNAATPAPMAAVQPATTSPLVAAVAAQQQRASTQHAAQQLAAAAQHLVQQHAVQQQAVQQLASVSAVVSAVQSAQQLASVSTVQHLTSPSAPQHLPVQASTAAPPLPPPFVAAVEATPAVSSSALGTGSASGEKTSSAEAPKCHMHRKPNKACKFCKAHAAFQDLRSKEADQKRTAAKEKLKDGSGAKVSGSLRQDDKVPLPNFANFPAVLKERLLNSKFYRVTSIEQDFADVKESLYFCDSCEPELRSQANYRTC
jgi:hypothetical protein